MHTLVTDNMHFFKEFYFLFQNIFITWANVFRKILPRLVNCSHHCLIASQVHILSTLATESVVLQSYFGRKVGGFPAFGCFRFPCSSISDLNEWAALRFLKTAWCENGELSSAFDAGLLKQERKQHWKTLVKLTVYLIPSEDTSFYYYPAWSLGLIPNVDLILASGACETQWTYVAAAVVSYSVDDK